MPTRPAKIAARIESLPRVADTVCTFCASTLTGKAPRFSTRASERASDSLKLPLIVTRSGKFDCCTVGADWMMSSSTIASCPVGHVAWRL